MSNFLNSQFQREARASAAIHEQAKEMRFEFFSGLQKITNRFFYFLGSHLLLYYSTETNKSLTLWLWLRVSSAVLILYTI